MFSKCLFKDAVNRYDLNPVLARIGGGNGSVDSFYTADGGESANQQYDVAALNLS